MAAAPMQYEQAAGPVSRATAATERPCGITDTTAGRTCPLKIKNKLNGIVIYLRLRDIDAIAEEFGAAVEQICRGGQGLAP
jgi:hypothetical protein